MAGLIEKNGIVCGKADFVADLRSWYGQISGEGERR